MRRVTGTLVLHAFGWSMPTWLQAGATAIVGGGGVGRVDSRWRAERRPLGGTEKVKKPGGPPRQPGENWSHWMIRRPKNESNPRFGRVAPRVYDCLSNLGRDELRVLVALGRYADANWMARPSFRTLTHDTALDSRHLARAITSLVNRGLIKRKPGDRTITTEYDLQGTAIGGSTVLPPVGACTAMGGNGVLPRAAVEHSINISEQQQHGAAAVKILSEDGRSLDEAKQEVQRRIAAGQTIRNPAGLAHVLARDGWDAAEPKIDVAATIREARNAKLAELRKRYGLSKDFEPTRPSTTVGVPSDVRRAIENELAAVARRIRAEHGRASEVTP